VRAPGRYGKSLWPWHPVDLPDACESGRDYYGERNRGVAQALMEGGVPAIVANHTRPGHFGGSVRGAFLLVACTRRITWRSRARVAHRGELFPRRRDD